MLTRSQEKKLETLFSQAQSRPGSVTDTLRVGNVSLMLRLSRPMWPVMHNGGIIHVRTLDVVQICSDYAKNPDNYDDMGNLKTAEMPRGQAAPIYAFLETICRKHGLSLRLECVISPHLRSHYIEKHGYTLQGHGACQTFETSVIKVLGDV